MSLVILLLVIFTWPILAAVGFWYGVLIAAVMAAIWLAGAPIVGWTIFVVLTIMGFWEIYDRITAWLDPQPADPVAESYDHY